MGYHRYDAVIVGAGGAGGEEQGDDQRCAAHCGRQSATDVPP